MELHTPPFRLKEIKVEVTQRCQLRCLHCSSQGTLERPVEVSHEAVMRILREAAEMGVEEIALSGGEPLLWPTLGEAVQACSARGIKTVVYTSGNVEEPETAMRMLSRVGAGRVVLSLFAADDDLHDRITQVSGSFRGTIRAIAAATKEGLPCEVHFVPLAINYLQLPAIIELVLANGIRQISVLRFVPHGRGAENKRMALTREQNLCLQGMIRTERGHVGIRAGSPYNFLLVNESPRCCASIDRLTISPDLRIYPCDAFKQIRAELIAHTDSFSRLDRWSLAECWEKSPYLAAIRLYLTTPFAEPCSRCELLERCLSGCLAQKVIANGTLAKSPDSMCLQGH
jgi:radical SAM protein with 4Fe4S-binding SPASM domain